MSIVCLILSFIIVAMIYADDWYETSLRYKLTKEKIKLEQERIKNFYNQRW